GMAVGLDELACEAVAELVPIADARRIDLGVSSAQALSVRGDADDLRTLLRNLVDNAVRYTGAGGRVDVSVAEEEEEEAGGARAVRLTVGDAGPGIPPEG